MYTTTLWRTVSKQSKTSDRRIEPLKMASKSYVRLTCYIFEHITNHWIHLGAVLSIS